MTSKHYPHRLAAVYPDRHSADAAVKTLGTAALKGIRMMMLTPGGADAGKAISPGNDTDPGTIDGTSKTGAVAGRESCTMREEAPVLFVSAAVVDPLIVLGYGTVIGCTEGTVHGLRLRQRTLAGLLRDSLKAGCHVVMLHATSHSSRAQAEALIRTTLPPRSDYL